MSWDKMFLLGYGEQLLPLMYQWYFGSSQLGGNSSFRSIPECASLTNAGAYSWS